MLSDVAFTAFSLLGLFFFMAGSIGLLRFPDLASRLHALTKADNVGLGCIAVAVAIRGADTLTSLKLLLIWLIVLASSGLVTFLVAKSFAAETSALQKDDQ
jgi:multicomponent Na+:H+ antiporter subunit G